MTTKKKVVVQVSLEDLIPLATACFQHAQREKDLEKYFRALGVTKIADEAQAEYMRFMGLCNVIAEASKGI